MNDTDDNMNEQAGIELTSEVIEKMGVACNKFGEILHGMTGPQIALVFAASISSWLLVHTESLEQSLAVLDFIFDKARESIINADHSNLTAWPQKEGEPN